MILYKCNGILDFKIKDQDRVYYLVASAGLFYGFKYIQSEYKGIKL